MSPDLSAALREETPAAPERLRERVALIAATPPPPRRTFTLRRTLLWAAPAAAAGSLAVAVVAGVIASSSPPAPVAQPAATEESAQRLSPVTKGRERRSSVDRATVAPRGYRAAIPPNSTRAQNVQADLRILVNDPDALSTATQRALRTTRRLGGYLVSVDYGTPEPTEGAATVRVRIPVSRVQAAILSFSDLGRILAQHTQITDLQQRLDELTRQIRRAEGDKARIAALRRERTELNRRAAYATIDLALTTHEPEKKAAPPGRLDRAVDDAAGVLAAELAVAAYILIVASPFLVLLAAAFAASRAYRRYADQRLLERA
ncbi:MAG TPA: DUF4349 domain-containing protein [Gaiellaceae bacterium]|nr:DUF4349 domain-containing protein [Gaiellaceae bacterium]